MNRNNDDKRVTHSRRTAILAAAATVAALGLPFITAGNAAAEEPAPMFMFVQLADDLKADPGAHTLRLVNVNRQTVYFSDRPVRLAGHLKMDDYLKEWQPRGPLVADHWELYDIRADFSLANDLAAANPSKLKEMQDLFTKIATENHVLPIDDRSIERLNATVAGRPDLMGERTSLTVYPGMTGMNENAFINVKCRSFAITAEIEVPDAGANGVILAQAGRFGGWSLWLKDSRPVFTYNWLGLQRFDIRGSQPIAAGKATVRFEFAYDGGKPGSGGTGTILIDGKKVAEGRIDRTQPNGFSADDGTDVGMDEGMPVSEEYRVPAKFTGTISKVTIDIRPTRAADEEGVEKSNAEGLEKQGEFE